MDPVASGSNGTGDCPQSGASAQTSVTSQDSPPVPEQSKYQHLERVLSTFTVQDILKMTDSETLKYLVAQSIRAANQQYQMQAQIIHLSRVVTNFFKNMNKKSSGRSSGAQREHEGDRQESDRESSRNDEQALSQVDDQPTDDMVSLGDSSPTSKSITASAHRPIPQNQPPVVLVAPVSPRQALETIPTHPSARVGRISGDGSESAQSEGCTSSLVKDSEAPTAVNVSSCVGNGNSQDLARAQPPAPLESSLTLSLTTLLADRDTEDRENLEQHVQALGLQEEVNVSTQLSSSSSSYIEDTPEKPRSVEQRTFDTKDFPPETPSPSSLSSSLESSTPSSSESSCSSIESSRKRRPSSEAGENTNTKRCKLASTARTAEPGNQAPSARAPPPSAAPPSAPASPALHAPQSSALSSELGLPALPAPPSPSAPSSPPQNVPLAGEGMDSSKSGQASSRHTEWPVSSNYRKALSDIGVIVVRRRAAIDPSDESEYSEQDSSNQSWN